MKKLLVLVSYFVMVMTGFFVFVPISYAAANQWTYFQTEDGKKDGTFTISNGINNDVDVWVDQERLYLKSSPNSGADQADPSYLRIRV